MSTSSRFLVLTIFLLACIGWGCSLDIEEGSQLAGQECTDNTDCFGDLVCVERRCRPVTSASAPDLDVDAGPGADVDTNSSNNIGNHSNFSNNTTNAHNTNNFTDPVDAGPFEPDVGPDQCDPGDRRCIADNRYERCVAPAGEPAQWVASTCPPDHICEAGSCVEETSPECCPGGCGEGALCVDCQCVDYDPDFCQYQDQPCNFEGQITNNFSCWPLAEGDLRCIGLCTPGAADPDATCPQSGSVCIFEDPTEPNGLCLSDCSVGPDDDCIDGMSCIHHGQAASEGVCFPTSGTAEVGQPCPPDDFFSCQSGAVCAGGICQQSCRPFDQDQTDCASGYCWPFGNDMGMCLTDTLIGDGQCTAQFTTCGADATGCWENPAPNIGLECIDFCRLDLSDDDCAADEYCRQFDPNNPQLGICFELMVGPGGP